MRPDCRWYQTAIFAPGEKPVARSDIGSPRVRITNIGGKELDVALGSLLAEICDQRGHDIERALVGCDLGLLDRRRKLDLSVR
jgi:hypothetical protein